ncbi:MAG TPA: hypothetical protein VKD69_18320 [Vicinamibacterales bacterium]|nr:hypothetical protein [Vicinamibacterales bacterium]
MDVPEYCREIETYLCRKNDGHLIRVVGPSFDLVSRWAEQGVPLKIACAGIDRYFERYYRKGPRRRPVKIDFCEADVLDVFDEWRRALGLTIESIENREPSTENPEPRTENQEPGTENAERRTPNAEPRLPSPYHRHSSLPGHLERVLLRLSEARARGALGEVFDALIDRVSSELDAARARAGGLRGAARQALIDRLAAIDAELLQTARTALDAETTAALARDADEELNAFKSAMPPDTYTRVRQAAIDRLVRDRFGLPTVRI